MKKIENITIIARTAAHKQAATELLKKLTGFDTAKDFRGITGEEWELCVCIHIKRGVIDDDYEHSCWCKDKSRYEFEEIPQLLKDLYSYNTITVKLNDKYSAEITKDVVKVGCQTFPHDIILKVADAIKEVTIN